MSFFPKKCVVVPVDFSESSIRAIDVALELVSEPTQLHVIHVTLPLHVAEPGMLWGTMSDASRVEAANKALLERITAEGHQGVKRHTIIGNPAREISQLAEQVGAELIVMPSHGRSGVERLFLGSVTEKVLRMAECPVLVLRVQPEHEELIEGEQDKDKSKSKPKSKDKAKTTGKLRS